jgi:hypothetical protein
MCPVSAAAADLVFWHRLAMAAVPALRHAGPEKKISRKTSSAVDYARFENKRKLIVELFCSFMLFLDYIEPAQKG